MPKPLLPLFCYLLKMLQSPADEGGDVRHEGQIVYFVLPIAEMDYEVSNGFVGDRFSK